MEKIRNKSKKILSCLFLHSFQWGEVKVSLARVLIWTSASFIFAEDSSVSSSSLLSETVNVLGFMGCFQIQCCVLRKKHVPFLNLLPDCLWGYTVNDFSLWIPFTLFKVLIFFHPNSSIDGLAWSSSKPWLAGTCWPVVIWSGVQASLSCGKLITSSQCSLWLESTWMQPCVNWWPCNWFLCIHMIKDEWLGHL